MRMLGVTPQAVHMPMQHWIGPGLLSYVWATPSNGRFHCSDRCFITTQYAIPAKPAEGCLHERTIYQMLPVSPLK